MGFNLDVFLDELKYLVNTESGSMDIEGLNKMADFFEKKFKELDFIVDRIELSTGPCLKMCSNDSDMIDILMIGHMDTVFKKGITEEWSFSMDDEKAYGPGVSDMKAGLLQMYEICKVLGPEFLKKHNICVIMNPDEEISSAESKNVIIEETKKAKNAFIFESSRLNGALVKQRKGLVKYILKFTGVAAHSGVDPENGRSAVNALAKTIVNMLDLVNLDDGRNLNFGTLKGGTVANVVAEHAEAHLDLRYERDDQIEEVEKRLDEMVKMAEEAEVKMEIIKTGARPPLNPTEKSMALIELFNEVAAKEGETLEWVATGGGSDGNFTSYYGTPTIDAVSAPGAGGHSTREYLEITKIEGRVKLLTKLIQTMAERNVI